MGAAQAIVASGGNEWYTPSLYVNVARSVLGGIDLDPASCVEANQRVRARRIYTKDDDGLLHDWNGRVWMNPPYGRLTALFVRHFHEQAVVGNIEAGIVLVNANSTDTRWFQLLWDYRLCFTDHRIDFSGGRHSGRRGSTHGSVFAYYGPHPSRFSSAFSQFGAIVSLYTKRGCLSGEHSLLSDAA